MPKCKDCFWYTGEEKIAGKECMEPKNQERWKKGNYGLSVKYKKPNTSACKKFRDLNGNPLPDKEENKPFTSKWMGLWEQERPGIFAGQVIKKSDIPKYTRIVLKRNKFYEKGTNNRPKFVFCFSDSEGYESRCVPIEEAQRSPYKGDDGHYYTEDGERLFTREDARAIINGTVADVEYGIHDPYDILPEDFC